MSRVITFSESQDTIHLLGPGDGNPSKFAVRLIEGVLKTDKSMHLSVVASDLKSMFRIGIYPLTRPNPCMVFCVRNSDTALLTKEFLAFLSEECWMQEEPVQEFKIWKIDIGGLRPLSDSLLEVEKLLNQFPCLGFLPIRFPNNELNEA